MRRADLTIVAGVGLLVLVALFWFVILAPKRTEANDLQGQVDELETSVQASEQLATTALAAQEGYGENYHRLVVLGKAVPEDSDTPSLLVQIQRRADHANVGFDSITLAEGAGAASAAAQVATPPPLTAPAAPASSAETQAAGTAAPAPTEGSTASTESATGTTAATQQAETAASTVPGESATATAAAPTGAPVATEATAATLPIGATVGPAGLPVMPYDLTFTGGFFEVADFLHGLDDMVRVSDTDLGVRGRLLTIDGFSLTPIEDEAEATKGAASDPELSVSLAATTYLTPAEQGLVAGATPAAPATTTPAAPVPASNTATPAPAP